MPTWPRPKALGVVCREDTGPYLFMFPCPDSIVREEAQSLIKQFFLGRVRCESEADWHSLCGPQR